MSTLWMPGRSFIGASLCLLAACGSDSTAPGGGGPAISVAVVPSTASLLTSGSQDFAATVANEPTNSGVTWSITGCSGGASACGTLSNVTSTTATYTAPTTVPPGTLGVTATSVSDNRKSVTARVAITAIVADGQIAFTSIRDGNREIYLMHADGTALVNLTNNPAQDEWPAWSPDGSKILFLSASDGRGEIYVMNADGSGVTQLTTMGTAFDPAWSPDGTKIAFDDGNEIYVINADGSGLRNITNDPAHFDGTPVWSPDGSKIAFESNRDGNAEVYVMNADGSALRNLTNNPAIDFAPAWRPRGP